MSKLFIILFTTFVCACCASASKTRIFQAEPLEPEGWYENVYKEARTCIEEAGGSPRDGSSYGSIEWYVMPAESIPGIAAMWSWPNRIYLDERFVVNGRILRHELLHHLLGGGDYSHEHALFKRCLEP